MKETKEIRNVKKYGEKIFTKTRRNSRIKKNYIPFEVSCEIYKRRSGLYMESISLNEAKRELSKKYKIKERVVEILFEKCRELNYNINESKEIIMKFFKYKQLVQNLSIDLEKNSNV